jgi:acyl transferase domain-containing protein
MSGESGGPGVAIVGMAGRFPGAGDVDGFWRNIKAGRECVTRFKKEELEIAIEGLEGGDYVCAKGFLDDVDMFDARFFGYLPREADVMDPQHRMFLELCWEALENAGTDPRRYPGAVGVWGGCYMDTYVLWNLCSDEAFRARLVESIQVGSLQTELGNDKDYLATRVAFKLGLRGPAMTIQTACSTSLVAIVSACQALEAYSCDMALAGGVTIVLPQKKGYFYKEGGMLSKDGSCRTFDADAAGTVFSNGAAVVALKRLEDALAEGDEIYSVIRGYAFNNDGGDKVSYTAPSVEGQAEVVSLALKMGGIDARTIGYVEAHGTATPLGDPIEIAGLARAWREDTEDKQFCAIGSLKANLGHLDVASGAIGLIKTSLALHEKTLPPQINFTRPNPKIDFAASPFYVNTELREWPAADHPRRAAVSSFGVGGTNAHVVAEEAPARAAPAAPSRAPQLLVLSARSEKALADQAARLSARLNENPGADLADVAWTLQTGRAEFEHRRAVVAATSAEAAAALAAPGEAMKVAASSPELVFMFPGQGAQHPGMGGALYRSEPVFRAAIDEIAAALGADEGGRLKEFILWREGAGAARESVAAALQETANAQPAIFAVEVALARLLMNWGLKPAAFVGHSVGEFAAATLSGVVSIGDAARLVAARGRLMQALPTGRMLAVRAPLDKVRHRLPPTLSIAAVNSPNATVVSGPARDIEAFKARLEAETIGSSVLMTSHAFHSAMMAPAEAPLAALVAAIRRAPGEAEIHSTLTGARAEPGDFADPAYWGRQLMSPVLFADAVRSAGARANRVFLEVGPGQALTALAAQALADMKRPATACLGPAGDPGDDLGALLRTVGRLWGNGVAPDWTAFQGGARRKVALPTYPFERKRHWIAPKAPGAAASPGAAPPGRRGAELASGQARARPPVQDVIESQLKVIEAQLAALRRR